MTKKLLMGNEAFAYAALEAGASVLAGYPGTPSSEVIEAAAKLKNAGVAPDAHVEWSINEKSALEIAAGAGVAGARTLFTCKQVGLNVASDALMSLVYVGVKGGTVLFVADDPGPISSQTEQDTRRFAAFAKLPLFDPISPDQGYAMIRQAYELSEAYGTPVIVRPSTRICHASTFFDVPDATQVKPLPEGGFEHSARWVVLPGRAYEAHGEINERLPKIADDFSTDPAYTVFNPIIEGGAAETSGEAPRLGIMAGGVSAAYTLEALQMIADYAAAQGVKIPAYRFMQVGTPYPFPEARVAQFTQGLDTVLVLEELDYVLEDALTLFAGRTHAGFSVRGMLTGDTLARGENSVEDILVRLVRYFGLEGQLALPQPAVYAGEGAAEIPSRPPILCAGCPHRGSFYAVKKALGKTPAVFCGDIGCYTLGIAPPLHCIDTNICMGGGITMAQGIAAAGLEEKAIAFVGDSTFFASGLTGVANATHNEHDITVVILDNSTTAMTGAQPHPGTGVRVTGERHDPISSEAILKAAGFKCIVTADPLNYAEAVAAAKEAIFFEGPSAIIFKSPCVQLFKPKQALAIDPEVCTGCKRCIKEIGCPGIAFDIDARGPKSGERGQAYIDPSLCNGCKLCTNLCPFEAIKLPEAQGAEGGSR